MAHHTGGSCGRAVIAVSDIVGVRIDAGSHEVLHGRGCVGDTLTRLGLRIPGTLFDGCTRTEPCGIAPVVVAARAAVVIDVLCYCVEQPPCGATRRCEFGPLAAPGVELADRLDGALVDGERFSVCDIGSRVDEHAAQEYFGRRI
ncbi:hypothetical protein X961_5845 [Burkholderia pseudomallei MSHR5613]|nr:hypothetical protein X961_5845 [Burkholderia pseudomallei MSHR5613]